MQEINNPSAAIDAISKAITNDIESLNKIKDTIIRDAHLFDFTDKSLLTLIKVIRQLKADYDELSSDHQAMGVALRQAHKNVNSHTARCTDLENQLEAERRFQLLADDTVIRQTGAVDNFCDNGQSFLDKGRASRAKCGLESGDRLEVHSNQADREAVVLAVLFDEPSALWHALIELCMPNGSTSLGILIADEDGTFAERDTDRFGRHRYIDKNVSYAKLPKKWLRAIGEQATESTEVTAAYPHSEVLCGQSQNGSIYIYRDGELDEVDPEQYFSGKLEDYPQRDKWTGPWKRRQNLHRERAENFFYI